MAQSTVVALDATRMRALITPTYTGADITPAVIMQRTTDGGTSWDNVRGDIAGGVLSLQGGTERTISDYELPIDTPVQYRTIKATLEGVAVGSTFNLSATVILNSADDCLWWIHPISDPLLIGSFVPIEDGPATLAAPRGIFYGVNAVLPIVTMGARQGRSKAKMVFCIRSNAERDALLACMGGASILCARTPASHGWGVRYVIAGDITETHPTPIQAGVWLMTVPYTEVAPPTDVVNVGGATYDQLAAAYATYTALQAAFSSYSSQAVGVL